MSDYRPIACAIHSGYELAILQGRRLCLSWCGPDGQHHRATLLPEDLQIRDGAEYLIAQGEDGRSQALRLDWISASEPSP